MENQESLNLPPLTPDLTSGSSEVRELVHPQNNHMCLRVNTGPFKAVVSGTERVEGELKEEREARGG